MGAYKKLNKQDAYITSRTAHKTNVLDNTQYLDAGITVKYLSGSLYNSVKQLYYPSRSEGLIASHSYDYYEQTTLHNPNTRQSLESSSFSTSGSLVMSIPRSLYGTYIKPGPPFKLRLFDMLETPYILREYNYWPDVSPYTPEVLPEDDEVIEQENETVIVLDDEEGGLYLYGTDPKRYIGDIIYSHGILVFTDPIAVAGLTTTETLKSELTWQTSHPIFTHTYHCRVKESEFNYTYNPTTTSTSTNTTTTIIPVYVQPQVTIGTQTWMDKNLNVDTYSDGTPIPQVTDQTAWEALTTGAWCYYNNDPANEAIYGKMYNWYAVAGIHDADSLVYPDLRKQLAPSGYHVAFTQDWDTLIAFAGGNSIAGGKLKSIGWSDAPESTDEYGFGALPGGYRISDDNFDNAGVESLFWTLSDNDPDTSPYYNFTNSNTNVYISNFPKSIGLSVRCVYDGLVHLTTTTTTTQTGILKDNVTGSAFQPYITTVGLYNDANELIAVGKMGQPVPKSANTEMTIVVKIDI